MKRGIIAQINDGIASARVSRWKWWAVVWIFKWKMRTVWMNQFVIYGESKPLWCGITLKRRNTFKMLKMCAKDS